MMVYARPKWEIEIGVDAEAAFAILKVSAQLANQADLDEVVTALLANRPLLASCDGRPKAGDGTEIPAPLATSAVDGGEAGSETPNRGDQS